MIGSDRRLTAKQGRFIDLYLEGPQGIQSNATRSAEAAGYRWPDKQGSRLMAFPHVHKVLWDRFYEMHPGCRELFRDRD